MFLGLIFTIPKLSRIENSFGMLNETRKMLSFCAPFRTG